MKRRMQSQFERCHRIIGWLVRPCERYHNELKECTKIKSRMFQYFVFGETLDCSQWETDRNNCDRWMKSGDEEAILAVINSEKKRRIDRLAPHVRNKVWEKREQPPEDWNKPVPQFTEKTKNSYITAKLKMEKEGWDTGMDEFKEKVCVIQ